MEGREIKRITFDDQGQDFMTFDVDSTGAIIDVQPFQYGMWSRCNVVNLEGLKPGDLVQLDGNGDFPIAPGYRLNYPVVSIENIVFSAEKIEALEREYNGWKDSPESEKRAIMLKQLYGKIERVKGCPPGFVIVEKAQSIGISELQFKSQDNEGRR